MAAAAVGRGSTGVLPYLKIKFVSINIVAAGFFSLDCA